MENQPPYNMLEITEDIKKAWWAERRARYNKGLLVAGIVAFVCYVIVGSLLIAPHDKDFEITIFTTIFQGAGYLFMMLIANLFYGLGYWADKTFNGKNKEVYRRRLFKLGLTFSCGLPFLVPISLIIQYLCY